jgi:protein kinase A
MSSITMAKATAGKDDSNSATKPSSTPITTEDDIQLCAIKILSKSAIIKAKQVDHVFNEMALQQSLNHPFIANLKGIQQDARSLYLVMDFVDGGELYKLI